MYYFLKWLPNRFEWVSGTVAAWMCKHSDDKKCDTLVKDSTHAEHVGCFKLVNTVLLFNVLHVRVLTHFSSLPLFWWVCVCTRQLDKERRSKSYSHCPPLSLQPMSFSICSIKFDLLSYLVSYPFLHTLHNKMFASVMDWICFIFIL